MTDPTLTSEVYGHGEIGEANAALENQRMMRLALRAKRFQNALRIMHSLDEVKDVLPAYMVPIFHQDPMKAAIRMDEKTWAKVYALIERRMP